MTPYQQESGPSADLHPQERIRWSGQPDPREGFLRKAPVGVGGLIILALASGKLMQIDQRGETFETIFPLLLISLSVWMMIFPFGEYRSAKRTNVLITDRRLIIAKRNGRSTTSIRISAVKQVECIRNRSSVTLRIPTALISDSEGDKKVDYTDLYGLKGGEEAYRLLTEHHA